MKLALCMIVEGKDKEAFLLSRALDFVGDNVDGKFITVTHRKGEKPNDKVVEVAKKHKAEVSHWEWDFSFANARNYNFAQVPHEYDYILWIDADDGIRGIEKLKPTLEKHQDIDCFSMMYLYSFDENKNTTVVHQKVRIIKNDGCVKWVGDLHEDFSENRTIKRFLIEGIEVLHLTDEERVGENKIRNIEVAEKMMKLKPKDPRSYWNLGNALKGAGKNKEAIPVFKEYLEKSSADEEKYLVHLRLAEIYLQEDEKNKALDSVRYAVGIRPDYPDAYHLMGHIYHSMRRLERARDSFLMGLTKKPPYHSIIVYNPRDYDAVPLKALAKVYFEMSLPIQALECLKGVAKIYPDDKGLKTGIKKLKKEADKFERVLKHIQRLRKIKDKDKLKKELDKLPDEVKCHPAVCNIKNIHFKKEKSSGKDVVIYCGYTSEVWTPATAEKKGIGGSEEAVLHLSKRFVKKGWNVTVYNNCGHKELDFDGVKFKPYWSWNYRDKQDIVILWRNPTALDYDINADKIFLDLHDVISPGEFIKPRLEKVSKIFVKSKFHRNLFQDVPDNKFIVIPNGIDGGAFEKDTVKDPYLLINTSSPDRSLGSLIDLFKRVKERVPEAKLKWAYGWNVFDVVHGDDATVMKWKNDIIQKMKETDGIEDLGRINHNEVAKLYLEGSIFAYPTEFAEIHCISAIKAQAAGAIPISTDFAALDESIQFGYKVHSKKTKDDWCGDYQFDFGLKDKAAQDEWVERVVETLKNPPADVEVERMRQWAKENYDWNLIADKWTKEFI